MRAIGADLPWCVRCRRCWPSSRVKCRCLGNTQLRGARVRTIKGGEIYSELFNTCMGRSETSAWLGYRLGGV